MEIPPVVLQYISANVPRVGENAVRKALLDAGWDSAVVTAGLAQHASVAAAHRENHHFGRSAMLIAIVLLTFLTFGALGYAYFFILSPTFVQEQIVPRPDIPVDPFDAKSSVKDVKITEEQVEYLAVAANTYKLHKAPGSDHPPTIEYKVTDTQETFTITVRDNIADAQKAPARDPDIRILGDKRTFLQLLSSPDSAKALEEFAKKGQLKVELLADEKTLALKGYMALYEAVKK